MRQEHVPPPIMRPVELTLVPDSVSTFEDVANALTRACEVCTLLSNQRRLMKNTFFLRASLITHLVTRVSTRGLGVVTVELDWKDADCCTLPDLTTSFDIFGNKTTWN